MYGSGQFVVSFFPVNQMILTKAIHSLARSNNNNENDKQSYGQHEHIDVLSFEKEMRCCSAL